MTQTLTAEETRVAEAAMNRDGAIDLARTVAICFVILLHTVSGITDTMPERMTGMQYDVYRCIEALSACGVPLFLMISGALLLDPAKEIPLPALLKKYVLRIALALLLFGTLFSFMEIAASGEGITAAAALESLLQMLAGNSWAHLWYLYAALGIYLVLPVLKGFARCADASVYRYVLTVLFLFLSVLPLAESASGFETGFYLPFSGIYVFYFLAGYYVRAYLSAGKGRTVPSLSVILCALLIIYCVMTHRPVRMDYESPVIAVYSVALFMLLLSVRRLLRFPAHLAEYVFGMYLTHTVFLNGMYKMLHITPLSAGGYVLIPVFFAGSFVSAYAASRVLALIAPLKKYVL